MTTWMPSARRLSSAALVVALIGISGALNYWAPLQPLIGILSVGLLGAGLIVRLRGEIVCPMPGTLGPGTGGLTV